MKTIAERVAEQVKRSSYHSAMGLPLGSDYPDIVQEITADPRLGGIMLVDLMGALTGVEHVIESKEQNAPLAELARTPAVCKIPLQWLYWGIQVGRELEREEAEVLRQMEQQK